MNSVPQVAEIVKCAYEGCDEEVFRDGICFDHLVEEDNQRWDDQDAERETCWAGIGR